MEIGVRHSTSDVATMIRPTRRCLECRTEALVMRRRHMSPPGWGEPVITEYYDCDYCEAQYSYSPATRRWKRITQ
jgi:hypothetical protein